MSIWNALQALLNAIIKVFYNMLSRVGAIRFTCGTPSTHLPLPP